MEVNNWLLLSGWLIEDESILFTLSMSLGPTCIVEETLNREWWENMQRAQLHFCNRCGSLIRTVVSGYRVMQLAVIRKRCRSEPYWLCIYQWSNFFTTRSIPNDGSFWLLLDILSKCTYWAIINQFGVMALSSYMQLPNKCLMAMLCSSA